MGNLKHCNLFMSLINQTFYKNRKLELNLHQNYNEKWNIFPQIIISNNFALSLQNKQIPHQQQQEIPNYLNFNNLGLNSSFNNTNSSKYSKKYSECSKNDRFAGNGPHFRGKIYKPIWSYQKFNSPIMSKVNNQKKMSRYYQFQQLASENNQLPPPINAYSIFVEQRPLFTQNQMINERTNFIKKEIHQKEGQKEIRPKEGSLQQETNEQEIEKKRVLKEKLINVFKNLSETKFI